MWNASGHILSRMSDVGRNLVPNIYSQPLFNTIQQECPLPSNLSQVGDKHQLGTNKVVPDLHIRLQLLSKKCGLYTSNHGPSNHLIT